MRKTLALLAAVVLVVVVVWWASLDFAVSIVPGWHTPILAPWAIAYIVAEVIVVGILLMVLIRMTFRGARDEERR